MNPSTALAATVVDELVRCGLTDAVLAPGSRSAPLALALAEDARVRLHVRVDERSAAFTALGLARATGRPAAVVCTSGSAVANLHPAVVEADTGRVPLLLLTADRPPELRAAGANQTIDQLGLYGRAVRWFVEVGAPDGQDRVSAGPYWRSTACRAWASAVGALDGPPGPVHCNLAFRDPLVPAPDDGAFDASALAGRSAGRPWVRTGIPVRGATPALVAELAADLGRIERGLIVAGDGSGNPDLAAVSARTGWPVLAEPTSAATLGTHVVACHDLLLRDDAFTAAHVPEQVLVVGRANLSTPLLQRWPEVPRVVVDPGAVWADPARTAAQLLAVDAHELFAALVEALAAAGGHRARGPWTRSWADAGRRARAAVDAVLDEGAPEAAPSEPRVARDLAAWLPAGSTLVVASSMPIRDLATYGWRRDDVRVLGNRGASGIDGFVSTAVGVALAEAGVRGRAEGAVTVALAGDLSLLHDAGGLLLRGQPTPDLVVVVIDNDGGGIFSFLPQAGFPERFEQVFGTPHGADVAALAAVSGAGYRRLERAGDLHDVLDAASAAGGVQLVHVRTERDANRRLHARLAKAAAAALAAGP